MANVLTTARERALSLFERSISDNPVVVKDLRTRMRGRRAFVLMGVYVLLMGVAMLIGLGSLWDSATAHGIPMNPMLGRDLFFWLNVSQVVLITLAIPSLTAGSLTQELENRTMDMLVLAPISPQRIVLGKQLSAFLYSLVLLACSLPIAAICIMLGGISPVEMAITYLLVMGWAFMLASAGVMWSSMANKMASASGNTFGFCIMCFMFSLSAGGSLFEALRGMDVSSYQDPFGLLNPVWAPLGSQSTAHVCQLNVPLALVSILGNAAVGVLFLLVASTHVWRRKIDLAKPIRILLLLISLTFTWLCMGAATAGGFRGPASGVVEESAVSLLLLIIFAAVFTAGEIKLRPGGSMVNYALSGRKAFTGDVGGAMSFVLLWALLDSVVFCATTAFASPVTDWVPVCQITIAKLAVLAGFCGIGIFASSAMKQRRNAIGLTVLVALVGVICQVFESMMVSFYTHSSGPSIVSVLWPLSPVIYATGHTLGGDVWWGDIAWLLTSAAYLTIGYLALLAAAPMFARTGGVVEDEH